MSKFSLQKILLAAIFGTASIFMMPGSQIKAQTKKSVKKIPATPEQIETYMLISIATFCKARQLKVDFNKSLGVALASQGEIIFSKHGGVVPGNTKPITQDQFLNSAPLMILANSLRACPEMVPADQKKKIEADIKRIKDSQKAK